MAYVEIKVTRVMSYLVESPFRTISCGDATTVGDAVLECIRAVQERHGADMPIILVEHATGRSDV